MPLLCFDLVEGRTEEEIARLLDATHDVVLEAFNVPQRDRYQIVREHKTSRMRIEDTGLGLDRSEKFTLLQVTSRFRTRAEKENFYRLLSETLADRCNIRPDDLMVTFVENNDEDWSFGDGRAQFLTGELGR